MAALRRSGQAPAPLAFFCPGSLLQNEFNTTHPVAFGMPASWPIFFEGDQAYRLKPGFTIQSEVVSRYPAQGPILQSGWLLGEELLRDQANVVAFRVGQGLRRDAGEPGRLPRPAARDVQAAVQRDLPRPVDACSTRHSYDPSRAERTELAQESRLFRAGTSACLRARQLRRARTHSHERRAGPPSWPSWRYGRMVLKPIV